VKSVGTLSTAGYRGAVRVRDRLFALAARSAFAEFGRRSVIQLPVRLSGESAVAVGSDVFVGAGSWIQVLDPEDGAEIVIGDGTSIAGTCVLSSARSIRIGRKVLMARNVYIADHGHAFEDPSTPVLDQGLRDVRPVEVRDGAWLGQNVLVGPGVTIGRGAVVGANSVVLGDVPDHSVAVGVPARVVRTFASGGPAEESVR
jgi:acetyltransferase-like isoleucine patch superfamily enzyme